VSSGRTGHAESVRITFDPARITYGQLLRVFFSVAHDPTELNRQGPDEGTQYRSVIFYANEEQKRTAEAYIAQLNQARALRKAVVTQVVPSTGFYAAEAYHQDFLRRNPYNPYIVANDLPKLDQLKHQLPALYDGK
jgi:peptide-methionine (S)-S-oxide reductase